MKTSNNRLRVISIVLLFIVALNALAAGYSFIVDPSGEGLGISTDYLKEWVPFKNYLIPGIVLFTINGLLSILIALVAIRKHRRYPIYLIIQGCILVAWIAIQLLMVTSFHALHAIIAGVGITLIGIGWHNHPSRIKY